MALTLLIQGIRRKGMLIYALLSMTMFFSLAVLGSTVERITSTVQIVTADTVAVNAALGIVAFLYVIFSYLYDIRNIGKPGPSDI